MNTVEAPGPVLNANMVDQWFANSSSDEQEGDRKTARMLRSNVAPRLASLQANFSTLDPGVAERELHSLRGSVGSFGFAACGYHLKRLEQHWPGLPETERQAGLVAAHEAFTAGLAKLFERFPHLRDS